MQSLASRFHGRVVRSLSSRLSVGPFKVGLILGMLLCGMLALSACQPIQPPSAAAAQPEAAQSAAEIPAITIHARDFAFDMPAAIPSGWVSLTLRNEGEVNHHAIVIRLKEGVTLEQLTQSLAEDDDTSDLSDHYFFMPDTDPGRSNEATVNLVPGTWAIFSVSMDGGDDSSAPTPDWALGSLAQFTVTDTNSTAAAPEADIVVPLKADDFEIPSEIDAGTYTFQFVNHTGTPDGGTFILELGEGATIESILAMFDAFFSGQPMDSVEMVDFHAVGGLMGHELSDTFYATVDLKPGRYAVISSINANDFPYSGLSKEFTVK